MGGDQTRADLCHPARQALQHHEVRMHWDMALKGLRTCEHPSPASWPLSSKGRRRVLGDGDGSPLPPGQDTDGGGAG